MDIKLWYSQSMKQWRWTLGLNGRHESGQHYHIRDAMNDVATTIEYLVDKHEYEGQEV